MNDRELPTRLTIQYVLVRADRRYAQEHLTNALPPDRMDTLIRAVDSNFGASAVGELELIAANSKALIGRLVEAVSGSWNPAGNVARQVVEALRQLRQVEAFLRSLNEPDKIVKHPVSLRETSLDAGLQVTPDERGVA
jgi:hypothetical protein